MGAGFAEPGGAADGDADAGGFALGGVAGVTVGVALVAGAALGFADGDAEGERHAPEGRVPVSFGGPEGALDATSLAEGSALTAAEDTAALDADAATAVATAEGGGAA